MTSTVSIIALLSSCLVSIVTIVVSWGKLSTKLGLIEKDTKNIEKTSKENQDVVTKAQESLSRKIETTSLKIDDVVKNTSEVKEKLIKLELELNGIQTVNQLKFSDIERRVQSLETKQDNMLDKHSEEIKEARHMAKDALSSINLLRIEKTVLKKKRIGTHQ